MNHEQSSAKAASSDASFTHLSISPDELHVGQYEYLLRKAATLAIISIAMALSLSFFLSDHGHPVAIGVWLCLVIVPPAVVGVRIRVPEFEEITPEQAVKGLRRTYIYSLFMGIIWGSSVFVFNQLSSDIDYILLILLVIALTVGIVGTMPPLPFKGIVFTLAAFPPAFWNLFRHGSSETIAIISLMVVFLVALGYLLFANYTHFKEGLRVRQALKSAHLLLENAIDSMGEGFAIYKADGSLIHANNMYRDMFPDKTMIQKRASDRSYTEELEDGRIIKSTSQVTPRGDIVSVHQDITLACKQEEALLSARWDAESANRAKSQFLAVMSHELRTPLNSIIGFADLIGRNSDNIVPQTLSEYSGYVKQSGQHLLGVISQILDLSRIEAGRFELNESLVSLPALVYNVVNQCQPMADGDNIKIVALADYVPGLWADEHALRQVLFNLISNAIKFSHRNGTITVKTMCRNDQIGLEVRDNGIGIAEDDLELIFQPFQQADNSLTRQHEGSGLGLPLVRNLVGLHGGDIDINSELGAGTVISVWFPAGRVLHNDEDVKLHENKI